MTLKNLLITLEGVDGVGKSSTSKLLANLINAHHTSTPPKNLISERLIIEQNDVFFEKFIFYRDSIIIFQKELNGILADRDVVCDRYIHSTFAYQYKKIGNVNLEINKLFNSIRRPDYSFLLTASDIVRNERIKKREIETGIINNSDHKKNIIEEARLKYLEMEDLIIIDTTKKTIPEVCKEIIEIIKK